MRKIKLYMMAGLLLLLTGSCAVTDIDHTADFYSYRTFAWGESEIDVDNPVYESDLIAKNIRRTIEKEFARRGIVQDKNDPDFLVSYHTYTEEKQEIRNRGYYGYGYPFMRFYPYYFGWGFPYMWGPPMWGSSREESSFTEGTLIVDITDSESRELVWRGAVKGNVDNISGLQKQIRKGIKAIMKKYPVTPQEPLFRNEKVVS